MVNPRIERVRRAMYKDWCNEETNASEYGIDIMTGQIAAMREFGVTPRQGFEIAVYACMDDECKEGSAYRFPPPRNW